MRGPQEGQRRAAKSEKSLGFLTIPTEEATWVFFPPACYRRLFLVRYDGLGTLTSALRRTLAPLPRSVLASNLRWTRLERNAGLGATRLN